VQRFRLSDLLNQILKKPPLTEILVTERPDIGLEIGKHFFALVIILCIGPTKGGIVRYPSDRPLLAVREIPEATEESQGRYFSEDSGKYIWNVSKRGVDYAESLTPIFG